MVSIVTNSIAVATQNASTPVSSFTQKTNNGYDAEVIVTAMFSSILAFVTIVGNGFVMLAYKVNYNLRQKATNICLVSLALCDFLVGLISLPLWTYYSLNPYSNQRSPHLYLFYISFDVFNGAASIFQLTTISLERCFAIVAPVRHCSVPVRFHYVMVFTVWILAAFSSLLRLLPYNNVTDDEWYHTYVITVCFVLPVFIMATSYALLFYTAKKRSRHHNVPRRSSVNLQASRRKTIVTLLVITCLFVITWTPFFTLMILMRHFPRFQLMISALNFVRLWRFVKCMHYCNSSMNPLVYAYRNKEFNHSFKAIIDACITCKRYDEVSRQLNRPNNQNRN